MDFSTLQAAFPSLDIQQNHPLAPYTTLHIGGPADIFINTKSTEEFVNILKYLSEVINFSLASDITILGNGSNVLISDQGIRGLVLKNSANEIEYLPNNQVKVASGVQLPLLITDSIKHSLSGLEEFAYIPSSLGGAVYGNIHGFNKNNFDKFLVSIEVFNLNSQTLQTLQSSDLNWGYDSSEFPQHPEWIITSVHLQLQPGISNSQQIIEDIIAQKSPIQSMNSAGSVFKNLPAVAGHPGDAAGRIIDQELHLKGFRQGDAQISEKHANFILNLGHATAADYLAVIKKIQSEAEIKGFHLEPEIKFLGEF
jgi:UDP-N-acetylmuramate dehydrogenase